MRRTGTRAGTAPPAGPSLLQTIASTKELSWPDERDMPPVLSRAPRHDRVSLRALGDRRYEVVGASGAIPERAFPRWPRVRVLVPEWGTQACVEASGDGSFRASVEAAPGNAIYVYSTAAHECTGSSTEALPGLVLRAPEAVAAGAEMRFSVSASFGERWKWIADGALLGSAPTITFSVIGAPSACMLPRLHLYRLFDADGEYVSQVNANVHGPVLTPTGLPLETLRGPTGFWSVAAPQERERCLANGATYSFAGWSTAVEPGWYRPRIVFYEAEGRGGERVARGTDFDAQSPVRFGGAQVVEPNTGVGYLPFVGVGAPKTPRLPTTLLNEDVSWGSAGIRGVQANEDVARFSIQSRRAMQGPFIASLREPLTGARRTYHLDPYLPTLGYTGFTHQVPQLPLIPLDERAPGRVSISVRAPDGRDRAVASDAPVRALFFSGSNSATPIPTTFAGPGRTFGLVLDETAAPFESYGRHVVTVSGTLRSAWGQDLALRGTYEVWVAEPLQLLLGTLQGTPLEIGQQFTPAVSVRPGVPALVEIAVDHYVDGQTSKRRTYRASGTANAHGYFVPEERWVPDAHGEYVARVTARFVDPRDGVLWMGTRSGASIVATPGTGIVAHGQRNSELAGIRGDSEQRTWFFNRALDPACGETNCTDVGRFEARTIGPYPFHRGDVAWLSDGASVTPMLTFEDPRGDVRSAVRPGGGRLADQVPLTTATSKGRNPTQRPDAIETWAYWYSSSVRADEVTVFHAATDLDAFHQNWYSSDPYNCQIGLSCFDIWDDPARGLSQLGDEEGDVKVFFGGAVIKTANIQQFIPYASMAVIIPEALRTAPGQYRFRDDKGQRVCPPYQGAAGGLATCGPLLTIRGMPVDLFITPTGTRPGSLLSPGDPFIFSGLVWPTLEVAFKTTVTTPSGREHVFSGRASKVGFIDGKDAEFVVQEPGVYNVRVELTQDRPVPSTGLTPSPPVIADGRSTQKEHGYGRPLSAILGSADSTYQFFVGEPAAGVRIETGMRTRETSWRNERGDRARVPSVIDLSVLLPERATEISYVLGIAGSIIVQGRATSADAVTITLSEEALQREGYTNVVLGADSLELSVAASVGGKWVVRGFNLRGMTPFGGGPITIR